MMKVSSWLYMDIGADISVYIRYISDVYIHSVCVCSCITINM